MGRGDAIVQVRMKMGQQVGLPERELKPAAPGEDLLARDRLAWLGLGRRIASRELVRREGAAVDDEAVNSTCTPGKRFTKDDWTALIGRALARGTAAIPNDVAGNEASGRWSREGRRIGRCGGGGGAKSGAEEKEGRRTVHRSIPCSSCDLKRTNVSSFTLQLFFGTFVCFDDIQQGRKNGLCRETR